MIDVDSSQSIEVSKIKIKIRKKCFSYFYNMSKYVSIDGILQAFVFFRFVDIIVNMD
jgi:phosphate starvation-inducible membrane PsiE